MPYNLKGREGSAGQFSLVLYMIFCCRQPFCEVCSKVKLELSLIFPASLIIMCVNVWLAVSLLILVCFMTQNLF